LTREVDGMLEEAKYAVVVGPVIIAVAMILGEHAGRGSADFLGRLEPVMTKTRVVFAGSLGSSEAYSMFLSYVSIFQ
jgi:hypothetical protein